MGFGIDMAKAREIHKTNIRAARAPKLAELDVEFQKALETGASTTDIVAKKQALRDAPADSGIAAAGDADGLGCAKRQGLDRLRLVKGFR